MAVIGPADKEGLKWQSKVSANRVTQRSKALDKSSLENAVHKLWNLDSLRIKAGDKVDESLENNIRFSNGRYAVKLPWKTGHGLLPTDYAHSLSRLKGQMRRLRKDPEVLVEYDHIIKDQLQSGIIEKVMELEKMSFARMR